MFHACVCFLSECITGLPIYTTSQPEGISILSEPRYEHSVVCCCRIVCNTRPSQGSGGAKAQQLTAMEREKKWNGRPITFTLVLGQHLMILAFSYLAQLTSNHLLTSWCIFFLSLTDEESIPLTPRYNGVVLITKWAILQLTAFIQPVLLLWPVWCTLFSCLLVSILVLDISLGLHWASSSWVMFPHLLQLLGMFQNYNPQKILFDIWADSSMGLRQSGAWSQH